MATFKFDKTLPQTPEETARQLYLLVEYLSYVINAIDEENFTQAIIEKLNKDNETLDLKKYSTLKNLVDGIKDGSLRGIGAEIEADQYQLGEYSVSLGYETKAPGNYCYAEGYNTTSGGRYNHVEGYGCKTTGYEAQHVEGYETEAGYGKGVHTEGYKTEAYGDGSHAEGCECKATGYYSAHAEGHKTHADGVQGCHAEGIETYAQGWYGIHAEGNKTKLNGYSGAHVEGLGCNLNGHYGSHAEGCKVQVTSYWGAHGEGDNTIIDTNSFGCHVEGNSTINSGHDGCHAEGTDCKITENSNYGCHVEGNRCIVGNESSRCGTHAEGDNTRASGQGSHTEGSFTIVNGYSAKGCHAEGRGTFSRGTGTHVEGVLNFAGASITDTATISSVTYQSQLQISTALNYTTNTEIILFYSASQLKPYNNVTNSTNFVVSSTYASEYEIGQALIFSFNNVIYRGNCTNIVNAGSRVYLNYFTLNKPITITTSDTTTRYLVESIVYPVQSYTNATKIYVNNFVSATSERYALINDTIYTYSTTSAAKAIITLDKNISGDAYCLSNDYNYRLMPANLTLVTGTTYSMDLEPIAHVANYGSTDSWTNYNLRICEPYIETYYNRIYAISFEPYSHCYGAHAEGFNTAATAEASHAEGKKTIASGSYSHASGYGTKATEEAQFVCGKYNTVNSNAVFSVGWGTDDDNRTNLFEVLKDGTATLNGSPVVTEARLQELGLI